MLSNADVRRNYLICYAFLALGCVVYMLGAPEIVIAFAAVPGVVYCATFIMQFVREQWEFAKMLTGME